MKTDSSVMLFVRSVTSNVPRLRGLGRILAFIAKFYRNKKLSDVEVSVFGNKMLLNPNDLIGNCLIFTPQWFGYRERQFIQKILTKGDYVIDVGANIGAYTLIFGGLVGSTGMVTAIEAERDNANRLKHNIDINKMDWVAVKHVGVSDKLEVLSLLLNSTGNAGGHSFYEQSDTICPPIQQVECCLLSELVEPLRKPKLMKLDIEGFEYRVLNRYFDDVQNSQWPDYIMIEDNPSRREDDAVRLLVKNGYKIINRYDANVLLKQS